MSFITCLMLRISFWVILCLICIDGMIVDMLASSFFPFILLILVWRCSLLMFISCRDAIAFDDMLKDGMCIVDIDFLDDGLIFSLIEDRLISCRIDGDFDMITFI